MRPPEAAMARTGNIFGCVSFRVMMAMIRHPGHRLARRVEDRKEDENILNYAIEPQRTVSKASVITH
jgi:hypothetical protein